MASVEHATPAHDPGPVGAFIVLAVMAASTTVALLAPGIIASILESPVDFVGFLVLTAALQLIVVEIYGRGTLSFSGVGMLAIGFAFGPGAAMASGILVAVLNGIRRRGRLDRVSFDAATLAFSAAAGSAVYHFGGAAESGVVAQLLVAVVAALTFFVVNVGMLSTAMALSENLRAVDVWHERFRWMTPYYLAAGPLAVAWTFAHTRIGFLALVAFALPPAFMMVSVRQYVAHTKEAVEELRAKNDELEARNAEITRSHREVIAALSRSIEAKDSYTGGHIERVSDIAVALARRLGFAGDELEAIEIGALLHDVGKIGVPEAILRKPGPLTDEEWDVIKQHPLVSDVILSEVHLHPHVREIARWSHERIDGTGYPDRLAGDDIPLSARIALVADAFDALTSDRPYRSGLRPEDALERIRECAGTQFCSTVVHALVAVYEEEPEVLGARRLRPVGAAA